MNNSNSSSDSSPPRMTLKLKGPGRKPPEKVEAPVITPPPGNPHGKPGAQWSDEYKRRMQADMDELHRK